MNENNTDRRDELGFTERLVDTAQVIILTLDTWGRIVRVNRFFEELTGYTQKQVAGESWFDTFLPERDRARVREVFARATGEEPIQGNVNPILTRDGREVPIEWYATTLKDEDDKVIGVLSVGTDVSKRERALSDLRESEKRFRALVEASPSAIIAVQDGRIAYMNRAGATLFGFETAKDGFGAPIIERIAPGSQDLFRERMQYLGQGLRNPLTEVEVLRTNGVTLQVETTSVPIQLGGDQAALIIARDITARKQAEDQIQRARKDWEDIFQAIGHATLILDPEHTVIAANRAAVAAHGSAEHELIGRKCHEVFHDSKGPPSHCPFERMLGSDRMETAPMEMEALDGWYLVSCTPVNDDSGRLRRVIHIATDITERKRAEDALGESEARFRATFEQAAVGIALAEHDGPFQRINQRFCDITGYSEQEMLELTYYDITHPDDREPTQRWVEQALRSDGPPPALEKRYVKKDGSVVWVNVSLSHVHDEGGNIVSAIGVVQDVSDRKRIEEQRAELEALLRQSQKMEAIGQLAGGVAHDFNNLLSPIMVYSDLMLQELSPNDPRHHELTQINRAADRARQLTRQLLAFGRKQVLSMTAIDLNRLVLGLEPMLRRTMPETIEIRLKLAESSLMISGDQSQVEQVLMNLMLNARDAMLGGGTLTIETAATELDEQYASEQPDVQPGSYVMLALSDTGHGMDHSMLSRIFEPFFTTKDRDKGTGLGLSTVYGIVKQHGGHVRPYSEPGRGTTFKVYFPSQPPEAETADKPSLYPDSLGGSETLLVLEDDAIVRETTCRLLERLGYQTLSAANGPEAIEVARAHDGAIQLLVADVVMPQMTGPEAYRELVAERPDLIVLYMSGYTDEAIARHGVLEDGIDYLEKPFTVQELATKVREMLDRET
jgi:PAS domain S-box-containing protein